MIIAIRLASVVLVSVAVAACACSNKARARDDAAVTPVPAPSPDAPPATPTPDGPPAPDAPPAAARCGGIAGFACPADHKCRYAPSAFAPPHPDAMGSCVAETYCDAPTDCKDLIHPMVLGAWACESNQCAWRAGPAGTPP